ncbi:unnamed protein product [Rhizophagus irregularis]|nr:unnamed protein product [Rhizophagus irregularis]
MSVSMSTPASYHMQFSDKLNEIENETNKFASNISTHEESLEKSMNKTGTYFTKLKSLNKEQLKDHFGMVKKAIEETHDIIKRYKKFYTYYAETPRIYERTSK